MKFRGIAVNVTEDGHPVQGFSSTRKGIDEWAKSVSLKHKCVVEIYAIIEKKLAIVNWVNNNPIIQEMS